MKTRTKRTPLGLGLGLAVLATAGYAAWTYLDGSGKITVVNRTSVPIYELAVDYSDGQIGPFGLEPGESRSFHVEPAGPRRVVITAKSSPNRIGIGFGVIGWSSRWMNVELIENPSRRGKLTGALRISMPASKGWSAMLGDLVALRNPFRGSGMAGGLELED